MKNSHEVFKETLEELGFAGYKPDQMTNSDYWLCTCTAMEKFAQQYGQALLQKASEEATLIINEYRLVKGETGARFFPFKIGNTYSINDGCFIEIDKDSILNTKLDLI